MATTTEFAFIFACEESTSNFALKDSIEDIIHLTLPGLKEALKAKDVESSIFTNNPQLHGELTSSPTRNVSNIQLISDKEMLKLIDEDQASYVILIPARESLVRGPNGALMINANIPELNDGEWKTLPDDHILVQAERELLRTEPDGTDEEGKTTYARVHQNTSVAMLLPPEVGVQQSGYNPEVYVRAITVPTHVLAQASSDAEETKA